MKNAVGKALRSAASFEYGRKRFYGNSEKDKQELKSD